MLKVLKKSLTVFAFLLVGPTASHALVVTCTNCAQSWQAQQIINAIQGASTAQTAAIQGAARVMSDSNAKIQSDMEKSRAIVSYNPIDPCSVTAMTNSTTGGAGDSMRDRGVSAGRSGGGGGGASPSAGLSDSMRKAVAISKGAEKAPDPEVQAALGARGACESFVSGGARARACTGAGFSMGNTSGFPNGDVRAETLFDGPQQKSEIVRKLSYRQGDKEESTIEAFLRNLETPVDLKELSVAALKTDSGRKYMALRDAYEANMNLATKPARDQALMMRANKNTLPIIKQMLDSDDAPFVKNYLQNAYPRYASDGISIAELINLEAERRYKNPQWWVRMAQAPDRQLLQEQVSLQAANLWMMSMLLERVQQMSVINGASMGSTVRQEKLPGLVAANKAAY